jgi:hypothetical protein
MYNSALEDAWNKFDKKLSVYIETPEYQELEQQEEELREILGCN